MSDRIILETNGRRYVAKNFVGPLEYFNESIQVTDGLCCPNCGCPRTWIPVNEDDGLENYIYAKMNHARRLWKKARDAYKEGQLKSAANQYAEAMRLFYECASDLIDGTGFQEPKKEV